MAGVELGGYLLDIENGDGVWPDQGVQGFAEPQRIPFGIEIEMRHLGEGVDAGIGAPGAMDGRFPAGEFGDGLGNGARNAWAVGLDLPADEGGAVVFDDDAVARHG